MTATATAYLVEFTQGDNSDSLVVLSEANGIEDLDMPALYAALGGGSKTVIQSIQRMGEGALIPKVD